MFLQGAEVTHTATASLKQGDNTLKIKGLSPTIDRNTLNKTAKITVKDQYPKSTNSEVEVTLLTKDTTTPTFNKEDTGVVTWENDFNAGETKEFQISYNVKYPKDKTLNL